MTVECLCYWVLVWVALELSCVQYVALQLSLVLVSILTFVAVLLAAELDLLAFVLLSTYASVFIALSLVALHFGPFWLRAHRGGVGGASAPRMLLGLALVCVCYCLGGWTGAPLVLHPGTPSLGLLWQDLALESRVRMGGYVGLTHLLFFRLFVIETLGLNLYLFVGLVAALVLLAFRYV